jgi:hypothetical protein
VRGELTAEVRNRQVVSAAVNPNLDSPYRYAVSYWNEESRNGASSKPGLVLLFSVVRTVLSQLDCDLAFERPLALAFRDHSLYFTTQYKAYNTATKDFDRLQKLIISNLAGEKPVLSRSEILNTIGQPSNLAVFEDGTILIQITPNTDDNIREIAFYPPR